MAEKLTYEELAQRVKELEKEMVEHKKAAAALKRSEGKYRSLVETASDWIWEVDKNGVYTYSNSKIRDILGYESEEAIGKTPFDFMSKSEAERLSNIFSKIIESQMPFEHLENENIHKDGFLVTLETSGVPVFKENGIFVGYRGIDRNITNRKEAEKALQESEEKYRLLVKNITSVVYKGYKDWSVEFFDKKIELVVGYTADEFNLKGMKWNDIIFEEDIETAKEIFIKALKTDKSYVREYRIKSKAGDIQWIQERGYIICDNKGEIDSVNGVFFNITERKRAEEEREKMIRELQNALAEIKTLSGLLPICAHCKNIRDDKGYWNKIEAYIHKHSDAEFTHGICPECAKKYYPDMDIYDDNGELAED
jgi:PAS domain S-box-containing protein